MYANNAHYAIPVTPTELQVAKTSLKNRMVYN